MKNSPFCGVPSYLQREVYPIGKRHGTELFNQADATGETDSGDETRRWISTLHTGAAATHLKTTLEPVKEQLAEWVEENLGFASPKPGHPLTLNRDNMAAIWNSAEGEYQPPHIDRRVDRVGVRR